MQYTATLACANPLDLKRDIDELIAANVDMLHIDMMDGHYVPNLSMNFDQIAAIRKYCKTPLDVHIMATNPETYLDRLAKLGVEYIAFHPNTATNPADFIKNIQSNGIKAGIVINPADSLSGMEPLLPHVDYLICMGVTPGFSGQQFKVETFERIAYLADWQKQHKKNFLIFVDGGVGPDNAKECAKNGADALVCGAFVCFGQKQGIRQSLQDFMQFMRE